MFFLSLWKLGGHKTKQNDQGHESKQDTIEEVKGEVVREREKERIKKE
jgi:hypothetical protein